MSIFGKIMSAIFGSKADAAPASGGAAGEARRPAAAPHRQVGAVGAPAQSVDVAAILDKAVAAKKEKLEWRTSIVDLMKALDIDSSLAARKELAKELGYTGDTNDSASMNIWLHKQVMASSPPMAASCRRTSSTDRSVPVLSKRPALARAFSCVRRTCGAQCDCPVPACQAAALNSPRLEADIAQHAVVQLPDARRAAGDSADIRLIVSKRDADQHGRSSQTIMA